jgi:hypothetical protein
MIASVDIASIRPNDLRRGPLRGSPGLRWAEIALLPNLASLRPPSLRRAARIAFWDDQAAARSRPSFGRAATTELLLRPLRAFGSWPGLDVDLPRSRHTDHDGPVVVLTLGRLRLTQTVRFLRTSRPAEKDALAAPGFDWGTAAARPPFVATITSWTSADAATTYAYGRSRPHDAAIAVQRQKDFHHQSAFIRFAHVD